MTPISINQFSSPYLRQYEKTEQDLTQALQTTDSDELKSVVETVIEGIKGKSNGCSWKDLTNWAIKNGCAEALKKIVACNEVSKNALDHIFQYSVIHCAESDYQEVLLSIIQSSHFCEIGDDNLSGAFQYILKEGHLEVVQAILSTTRNKKEYLTTPFFHSTIIPIDMSNEPVLLDTLNKVFKWAIEGERKDLIPFLLPQRNTHKAVEAGYEETIKDLLADNNLKENMKEIVLDVALRNNCVGIVGILLG